MSHAQRCSFLSARTRKRRAARTPSGLREVCWHASGWSMHDASCAEFALAWPISARPSPWTMCRSCARAVVAPACCARCSWRRGVTFLTRFCLAGCADFTVSYFHFHFFSGKEISAKGRGGIGPSRRLLFSTKFRAPPLSASLLAGERGGYNYLSIAVLSYDFKKNHDNIFTFHIWNMPTILDLPGLPF